MKDLKKSVIICSIISSLIIISVLSLFGFCIILLQSSKRTSPLYQVSQFNPKFNSTSIGVAKLNTILTGDQFISYWNDDGCFFSISKFSSRKYECHGTCICVESGLRRYSVALSKGLMFLVFALTSTFALQISSEYFRERCLHLFEGDCSDGKISSEVDNCEPSERETKIEEDPESEKKSYHCTGFCVPNSSIKMAVPKQAMDDLDCLTLGIVGDIEVDVTNVKVTLRNYRALRHFHKIYLAPYCLEKSKFSYIYNYYYKQSGQVMNQERNVHLCVGMTIVGHYSGYSNIKCEVYRSRLKNRKM